MTRNLMIAGMILSMLLMVTASCSPAEESPADENQNPPAAAEDQVGDETTYPPDLAGEVLFDGNSVPEDWPDFLPILPDMMVTEYSNSSVELHAFGYAEQEILRLSNWCVNMFINENIMVDWEQDPEYESIQLGDEQIFFVVREGWALAIELTKVEDTRCSFDYIMIQTE